MTAMKLSCPYSWRHEASYNDSLLERPAPLSTVYIKPSKNIRGVEPKVWKIYGEDTVDTVKQWFSNKLWHKVLLALAHLQHHRIVHPGVKPANLFSMLADFGISIPADGSASIPRCGAPLGCVGLSDRFLQDVAMPMQHFGDKVRVVLGDPIPESLMLFLGSMVCRCRKQLWRNI